MSVGDGRRTNGSKVRGTLNIFPQGVVSNLVNTSRPQKGAGVYLKVGVGRSAYGCINQLGGSLYHNSNLQCMIGAFLTPSKGTLSVEDGTFHTPSNLFAAVVGEGFVSVGPGAGVIEAKNVTLSNTVCEVGG